METKKWDMAAAVASHLVKTEPENSGWWINLAYATRRCEGIESAEAILLWASEFHHDNAVIESNLALLCQSYRRMEDAKERIRKAIQLIRKFGYRHSPMKIFDHCGIG